MLCIWKNKGYSVNINIWITYTAPGETNFLYDTLGV